MLIAFYGESTVTDNGDNDLHVDNVMVYNATSCVKPSNLSVSAVTANSVTLAWGENGSDTLTTCDLIVLDNGGANGNYSSNCNYTLVLYPETAGSSIAFITPMVATAIPYNTDFSDGSDQNWLLNNGSCANGWMIGAVSDSDNALFISSNNNTPGYNTSVFSVVTAEKIFTIGEATEVIINFDVKVGGEDEFDFMPLKSGTTSSS